MKGDGLSMLMARYREIYPHRNARSGHWMPVLDGNYPAARIYGVCPKINTYAGMYNISERFLVSAAEIRSRSCSTIW